MAKRFTQKQYSAALGVSLVDYLTRTGHVLKPRGRDFCLAEHDSLVISRNNKWHWFSRGFGGRNTIDYMTAVEGIPYVDAVIRLSEFAGVNSIAPVVYTPAVKKADEPHFSPILPWRHENHHAAFAYLNKTRGIDGELISQLMHQGLIYQAADVRLRLPKGEEVNGISAEGIKYLLEKQLIDTVKDGIGYKDGIPKYMQLQDTKRNTLNGLFSGKIIKDYKINFGVVFLGNDEKGDIAYASKRSTNSASKYRQDALGSDKSVGFHLDSNGSKLFVTESPIDALSVISIAKSEGVDYRRFSYLSLGGVSDLALDRYLKGHRNIKEITFCLDNDDAGIRAMTGYSDKYSAMGYTVKIRAPISKDYNDDLLRIQEQEEMVLE